MTGIAIPSHNAEAFISEVVNLDPKIAVFDCDSTLWAGDSGKDFMEWSIGRGVVRRERAEWITARYADYQRGNVGEETMCGEMVQIYAGLGEKEMEELAAVFFDELITPRIFPEMRELTLELKRRGCQLWAVSSTNVWVVREGICRFGIPGDHGLAAHVATESGVLTDRLLDVPSGPAKAAALRRAYVHSPCLVCGNSIHDQAMLEIARYPYAINPNADLAAIAAARNWPIHFPLGQPPGTETAGVEAR